MQKLVFATGNKGKYKEVKHLFNGLKIELLSLSEFSNIPDIIEDGSSFEENARIKARAVYEFTGIPAIADDSGISVDQLNGRPGIYSARYAGENAADKDNNNKLLEELSTFPEPHLARYICSAVYYDGKSYVAAYGELKGRIITEARGSGGFGYDPLFVPEGYNITAAEMELEEKNRISHRAKAFMDLKDKLLKYMENQL